MKCPGPGCDEEIEPGEITHSVTFRRRRVVIERVPAEICPGCGHTRLQVETVARIDLLLRGRRGGGSGSPLLFGLFGGG